MHTSEDKKETNQESGLIQNGKKRNNKQLP